WRAGPLARYRRGPELPEPADVVLAVVPVRRELDLDPLATAVHRRHRYPLGQVGDAGEPDAAAGIPALGAAAVVAQPDGRQPEQRVIGPGRRQPGVLGARLALRRAVRLLSHAAGHPRPLTPAAVTCQRPASGHRHRS